MNIIVMDNYQQMSKRAAGIIADQILFKPDSVLGLPTGSTPEGMYEQLIALYKKKQISFSEVTTFNLDEYVGIEKKQPQSYSSYMYRHLFTHIDICEDNINIPVSATGEGFNNLEAVCIDYDRKISQAGGIDFQVLGLGENGHIGFNEPASGLTARTHIADLSKETIESNSRFFSSKEAVPRQAISMGMADIINANRIMVLACDEKKASAVKKMVAGKITTEVPASFLQLHREVILLLDRGAASLL